MDRIERMFDTHPHPAGSNGDAAHRVVLAAVECAQTCAICADACLAEDNVSAMVDCVRLNLDCADVCAVTARLIARPSHRDAPALRAQLQACAEMCRACADECGSHADDMEHCRVCAEACRECAEACEAMVGALVP